MLGLAAEFSSKVLMLWRVRVSAKTALSPTEFCLFDYWVSYPIFAVTKLDLMTSYFWCSK